jgi:long-subunit fatty acid transport protein
MKNVVKLPFFIFILVFIFCVENTFAQSEQSVSTTQKSEFWSKVRFGGGFGIALGNNYTDITLAPGAIYDFNQYISLGFGIQGSYVRQKNFFESYIYGANMIVLGNPIPEIQLSAELEQLRVNTTYENNFNSVKDNFWNTGLFLGAGYQTNNVTIGLRYNVLHNDNRNVYSEAWMPFVRVYF